MPIEDILPEKVNLAIEKLLPDERRMLTDIRLRVGKPILLTVGEREYSVTDSGVSRFDGIIFTKEDADKMWSKLCLGAPYAKVKNQRQEYFTVDGNRIGFSCSFSGEKDKLLVENINSFCVRICREVKGCSRKIEDFVFLPEVKNTLIISPPGCGKTTMLRDLVRNATERGYNVSLIDERNEISACSDGIPKLDLGKRCDVIENVDKQTGIENAVRALKPDIICVDEIGKDDIPSVLSALTQGVKVFASAHAYSPDEARKRLKCFFDVNVLLDKIPSVGTVKEIFCGSKTVWQN